MARRNKKGRQVNGIFLLDKPTEITSNAALQVVKRLFNARKAGHTGSLDPLATGMLPICLGEATKVSAFLLDAHKKYRTTIKLGVKTTTGDAEGDVIETRPVNVDEPMVRQVLTQFLGKIEQTPPMHSAIKINGMPLYKLARQGLEVERKSRIVEIFDLGYTRLDNDELQLDVHCSKGTYIRVLAEEIGAALGCGGHVQALHRYEVGPFKQEDMVSLEELRSLVEKNGAESVDPCLLPMEYAISHWPQVNLTDDAAYYLCQGQAVFVPRSVTQGWVRLVSGENRFLGIGEILDDGKVAPRKLINLNQ